MRPSTGGIWMKSPGPIDRGVRLEEDQRVSGASTLAAMSLRVLGVVQADADHLGARDDRSQELRVGERHALPRRVVAGEHRIAREHHELVAVGIPVDDREPGVVAGRAEPGYLHGSEPSVLSSALSRVTAERTWPAIAAPGWADAAAHRRDAAAESTCSDGARGGSPHGHRVDERSWSGLLVSRGIRVVRFEFGYMAARRDGRTPAAAARRDARRRVPRRGRRR